MARLLPLVSRPEHAETPRKTRDLLQALRRTGASVVLVSGRAARDAHRVMGGEFDGILGNHGAEILRRNRLALVDRAASERAQDRHRDDRAGAGALLARRAAGIERTFGGTASPACRPRSWDACSGWCGGR